MPTRPARGRSRRSPTPSCRCSPSTTSASLRDVRVDGDGVIVEITPDLLRLPGDGRHARRPACTRCTGAGLPAVEVRTVLSPAWSTDWITARRPPQARRRTASPRPDRAAPRRRSGPAHPRPRPRGRRLPAVRVGRHRGALPVRRDRLQRPAPLPRLRRAVRAHEGDLMRLAGRRPPFHAAARRRRRAAPRRRGRGHLRRPRARCARRFAFRPGPVPDPAAASTTAARSGGRTRSARPAGAPPRVGVRRVDPAASSPTGWSTGVRPATRSRSPRRRGRSPPTWRSGRTTPSSPRAPGSRRCCRSPRACSPRTPDTTGDVCSTATGAPTP